MRKSALISVRDRWAWGACAPADTDGTGECFLLRHPRAKTLNPCVSYGCQRLAVAAFQQHELEREEFAVPRMFGRGYAPLSAWQRNDVLLLSLAASLT
jgi:hypothetical protein